MLKMAVVEDIKEDSDTLCGYVEKFSEETAERIDIRVFGNAVDFLDKYSSGFDIVLMDIDMPMLDGMAASRKLRDIDDDVVRIEDDHDLAVKVFDKYLEMAGGSDV